jgi:hypothetical protein
LLILRSHRAGRVLFGFLFDRIVDVDLGHGKLRDGSHATGFFALASPTEFARIVQRIKEADDRVTADSFLNTLESGPTTKEFFKPQTFVVADNLVVRKYHQALVERNPSVGVRRHEDLFIEGIQALTPLTDRSDWYTVDDTGEFLEIDTRGKRVLTVWS